MNDQKRKPPEVLVRIISWIIDWRVSYDALGEYEEKYYSILNRSGYLIAVVWYFSQIFIAIPDYIVNTTYRSTAMLVNYIKIALRNLKRNKIYSSINIFGLSIGIAGVVLIFLFIDDELSYDSFHKKCDRLYRLTTYGHHPDGRIKSRMDNVVIPHGSKMKEFFPEDVEYCVRTYPRSFSLKYENFIENLEIMFADKDFFRIFSFPLISGNPEYALSQPNSLVLSETYARKYFGNENPVGKTITLLLGEYSNDYTVTGIAEDAPSYSTIQYNMLIPFESMRVFGGGRSLDYWGNWRGIMQTYIELKNENSYKAIIERYPHFAKEFYAATFERMRSSYFNGIESKRDPFSFGLQKMEDIRLDPRLKGYPDLTNIYILSGIASGILLIACINFVTQSLGLATRRCVEVGMRKVVGAKKHQLIRQFLTESVIITFSAAVFGIVFAILAIPVFNELSEKSLFIGSIFSLPGCILFLSLMFLSGICAGSYPALVISKFKPVEIFRGRFRLGGKNIITKTLVISQFVCSIFLIISTIIMGRQIGYMLNSDPGFDRSNILIIGTQLRDMEANDKFYNAYKDRIKQYPEILNITGASSAVSDNISYGDLRHEGRKVFTRMERIGYDYFETLGIEITQGRDFSESLPTDVSGVIVNESLIKEFGIEDPVGKPLEGYRVPLNIIGVIKDVYSRKLRFSITPEIYYIKPSRSINYIIVKLSDDQLPASLDFLSSTWKELQPDKPFVYSFLDEDMENQYASEKKWKSIVQYSTFLAVLIACMGVFGLISITINSRIKEVSIRKIHGAKIKGLIALLSGESIKQVLVANVVAWPAVWFAMNKWLENYAYRIDISISIFIYAASLIVLLVFITISYQVIQAARANPVDSLRYE
ncbi:MAG: FtsX-like permease family protein [bacterium]|nr:FtsX-like permease family protein [bacterium]